MPKPALTDDQRVFIDVAPVREHLANLRERGMGCVLVARAAGLPETTVKGVRRNDRVCVRRDIAAKILAVTGDERTGARIPADRAAKHIRALHALGRSYTEIADEVGVSETDISGYAAGEHRWLRPYTERRILAVTYTGKGKGLVDATGSRRRLQALAVHPGWIRRELAAEIGIAEIVLIRIQNGITVNVLHDNAAAIRKHYPRMSLMELDDGPYRQRSRRWATKQGWCPPGAWDDDTIDIDDPAAEPNLEWAAAPDEYSDRPLYWGQEAVHLFLSRVSVPQIAAQFQLEEQTVRDRLRKDPRCAAILSKEPTARQAAA